MKKDKSVLMHIIKYCDDIETTINRFGDDFSFFENDIDYKNSISMSIMQIGELTTHLSDQFRKATAEQIPWNLIKAMRNHCAHGYFYMDNKEIYETAKDDVPDLKRKCLGILDRM